MSKKKVVTSQVATDRWFRVTAERFDWVASPRLMRSWKRGQIGYGTREQVEYGLSLGAIQVIKKPADAFVDKSGQVQFK